MQTQLENTVTSIFFKKPYNVFINEDARTNYASLQKIETLIDELKEKGPLVGLGKFGPKFYTEEPFKLDKKFCEHDIYAWKKSDHRLDKSGNSYFIVLGAKKVDALEHVYFTLSTDVTLNTTEYLREHKPSSLETKIYVTSHQTFSDYLNDLYPPIVKEKKTNVYTYSSTPSENPSLSFIQEEYLEELTNLPLNSILDRGLGEEKCRKIGQKIFDEYKEKGNGRTSAGKEAVINICDAIFHRAQDGHLRKQYIEHAWHGIGDKDWIFLT